MVRILHRCNILQALEYTYQAGYTFNGSKHHHRDLGVIFYLVSVIIMQ